MRNFLCSKYTLNIPDGKYNQESLLNNAFAIGMKIHDV